VRVGVELFDLREELGLRDVDGQPEVGRLDPRLDGGLVLEPDVDVRSRIVSDENGYEPDVPDLLHLLRDLGADAFGDRLSLDQRR
jgi:hypothetical protein